MVYLFDVYSSGYSSGTVIPTLYGVIDLDRQFKRRGDEHLGRQSDWSTDRRPHTGMYLITLSNNT